MDISESKSPRVHKCKKCHQQVITSLTSITLLSPVDTGLGYMKEWQDICEPSCVLCKLIAAVLKDASKRFSFLQNESISLRLTPKEQETLLGLKFTGKSNQRAYTGDIDCIFIYCRPENKASGLCPYRSIPRNTDSDLCFDTINDWIHDCKENHQTCGLSCTSPLPTRVLDIREPDAQLVEGLTEKGHYVALSHCWGDSEILKTDKSTYHSHKESIKLQSMPQNFKDAIYVSRKLGYEYLWIDSLCIIQGDHQDWIEQSSLMENVYHNADLVLAATCAAGPEDGFLVEDRPSYHESTISITLHGANEPTSFFYRLAPPHRCREGPLDKRGWAFQERLRARRYVSFGSRELTWSCQTVTRCECDSVEVVDDPRKLRERSLELFLTHSTAEELHVRWRHEIVGFYTQRKLSYSSDKLQALAAISDWFQKKLADNYIAGLWERDLILDLLWSTKKPGRRERFEGPAETFYNAPTWSWIASRGWTYYPLILNSTALRLATLISSDISSTLHGIPQFGFGRIVLRGKLVQATLTHNPAAMVPRKGGPFVVNVLSSNQLTSWLVNPDIYPPTNQNRPADDGNLPHKHKWRPGEFEGQPFPIRVLLMAFYPSYRFLYGLILILSDEHLATYYRVGIVIFQLHEGNDDEGEILDYWDSEQVTVI